MRARFSSASLVGLLLCAGCGAKTGLRAPDVTTGDAAEDASAFDRVDVTARDATLDVTDVTDVADVVGEDVFEPLEERCVERRVRTTVGTATTLTPGLDRPVMRGYQWTLDARPMGSRVTITGEDVATAELNADRPGEYRITVRVQRQFDAGQMECPIVVTAALADPRCPGDALVEPQLQTFTSGRTQLGLDTSFIAVRSLGLEGTGVIVADDEPAAVSAVAIEQPARTTLEGHAMVVEELLRTSLGAVPALVGRTGTAADGTPIRRSTYRFTPAVAQTPDLVRDRVVSLVSGRAIARTPGLRHSAEPSYYVELTTTVRPSAGQVYFLVTVASSRLTDDATRTTAMRVEDFVNGSTLAPAGSVNDIVCDLVRATRSSRADFLWFVDTSGSMNNDQQLVGQSAQDFFRDLNAASVDFRVGVLQAGSATPVLTGPPPFTWVSGADPMGARRVAFRVTSQPFGGDVMDTERPFPNARGNEEPAAASVLMVEELERRARAGETNPEFVFRDGAVRVVFWVTDEPGTNDDSRFFAMNPGRWGATVAQRVTNIAAFFRSRDIVPFGLVRVGTGVPCDRDATNLLSCVITAAGGAFVPINEMNVAERDLAFRAAMSRVVASTAGAGSEFLLSRPPISSSLRVRLVDRIVPRSRADGFDYDGAANALVFRGPTYRPRGGDEVRSAYFVWRAP
jgi:hypothetical protein